MKTPAHLRARVKPLQARLKKAGLDGMLITNPVDIRYLTGFIGDDSWAYIPATYDAAFIISDGRFRTHIPQEAPHAQVIIREIRDMKDPKNKGQMIKRRPSMGEAVAFELFERFEKVGLNPGHLSHAAFETARKEIGTSKVVAFDDGLMTQRGIKDELELKAIKKAIKIQQQAFLDLKAFVKPGMTELEICAYLEYRMKCLGADGPSFGIIIAVDGHASHNHAIPSKLKVKKDSSILIDWGCKVDGYCSDMTRVLNLGKPKAHIQRIYGICLESMAACEKAIKPGVSLFEATKAARDVIEAAGHTLDHGIGHGIGLDIHEYPGIGGQKDVFFKEGQIITIEPGIYLGDQGGVRIENDYLVTKTGCKCLCDLPKDWEFSRVR